MMLSKFPVKSIPVDMPENAITERIIKCAIAVHRELARVSWKMSMKRRWILNVRSMGSLFNDS